MIELIREDIKKVSKYVAGKTTDSVKKEYGLTDIVKLGSNENNFAPFDACKKAMLKEIDKVNIYPERNFVLLKKLIGEEFGLSEDNVCLGHGAGNIIDTIAKTFIECGDETIITKEAYHLYKEVCLIMGGIVKFNNVDENFIIDLDEVKEMITEKTKVIWLCNPNNPTGTLFDKKKFDEFMQSIPDNVVVVLDEAYVEYADNDKVPDVVSYIKKGYPLISVRTFSKYYGIAGQRIGYLLASKEMCNIIDTVSMPFSANRMGLAAAVACLTDGKEEIKEKNDKLIDNRKMISQELEAMGCEVVPSQTNFVLFKLPCDGDMVNEELLRKGIIVRPAKGWGFKDYIRVTVGTDEECKKFISELKNIICKMM